MALHKIASRKVLYAKHHKTYSDAREPGEGCVYCGSTGRVGMDHVPPLFHVEKMGKIGARWLYSCCGVCNTKLAAYAPSCLLIRADYLLCKLRAEWLLNRNGVPRLHGAEIVAQKGIAVKARIKDGSIKAVCRCRSCQSNEISETPAGRSLQPYAGQEFGQGVKPDWIWSGDVTTGI